MTDSAPANIVLIGYRGSGKTTVAKLLAERLGWSLVDTDDEIVAAVGKEIREIFANEGEPKFREYESQAVARACDGAQQVISVGGGAILAEQNRQVLRDTGACVWLTAKPKTLYARMQGDPRNAALRPALTDKHGLEEVLTVLKVRLLLYEQTATHAIDTENKPQDQVADEILTLLNLATQAKGGA